MTESQFGGEPTLKASLPEIPMDGLRGTRARRWRESFAIEDLGGMLLLGFVISMPLTDVLAVSPWLPPPLMFVLALGLLTVWVPGVIRVGSSDALLGVVVLACIVPYLWSFEYAGVRTGAHLFAFLVVMGGYYILVRSWLARAARCPGGLESVLWALAVSLAGISVYVLAEFILMNRYGVAGGELIPHLTRPEYSATVLQVSGLGVQRARGTAAESGTMAIFFEMAGFLSLIPLSKRGWVVRLGFYSLVLSAYAVLFSVGSLVSVAAAVVGFAVVSRPRAALKTIITAGGILLIVTILFPGESSLFLEQTFLAKIPLLASQGPLGSGAERLEVYQHIASLFLAYPFGVGVGITPELAIWGGSYHGVGVEAGQVSFYGYLLVGGGCVAILAYGLFYLGILRSAMRCRNLRGPLLMSGLAIGVHHMVAAGYWLPNLWFYCALVDVVHERRNQLPPVRRGGVSVARR